MYISEDSICISTCKFEILADNRTIEVVKTAGRYVDYVLSIDQSATLKISATMTSDHVAVEHATPLTE